MTRGDCGLTFGLLCESTLTTESTDSVESLATEVEDDSEPDELVRESIGWDGGVVDFSPDSSKDSLNPLSMKLNLELVPVTGLARPVPVDMDFRKSR